MPKVIIMPKRFDYSSMNDFNAAIASALDVADNPDKKIILDCTQMDYIDSSGLGLLVMAYKKIQQNNYKISMINIKPVAKEILLLANLQKLISIQ